MLFESGGVRYKLVCPECGKDKIGTSGLGGDWVHCFGHCFSDLRRSDCIKEEVTSPEEITALMQETY